MCRNGDDWTAKKQFPLTAFFDSEVFFTLLAMGVILLPGLFYGPFHWYACLAPPSPYLH